MTNATERAPVHVVLSATGGIGSALARRLAGQGCRLLVSGRDEARVSALASELGAESAVLDLTDGEAVDALLERYADEHGRIDGVVSCAGSLLLKPAHLTSDADWEATMSANLTTAFVVVRGSVRAMKARGGGAIALLSTAAARTGLPNHEAIAAAKAGVIGLALATAATYARVGIRVNVVAPGLTRTPLSAPVVSTPSARRVSEAMHPLGRLGEPGEVASALAWLVDPAQAWVTGQVLGVDGGLATLRGKAST